MSPRARLALLLLLAAASGLLVYWLTRSTDTAKPASAAQAADARAHRRPTSGGRLPALELPSSTFDDEASAAGRPLIRGAWGGGPGQFGRLEAAESNPEGPMSLGVDGKGGIWILDQVNQRLQRFDREGKPIGAIPLSGSTGQDLALTDDGKALVLDRLGQQPGVEIYGADGRMERRLNAVGGQIKEGGGITGLFSTPGGVYVENGHDDLVQVADAQGQQTDLQQTIPGRPTRDGQLYIKAGVIDKAAGRVYVQAHDLQKKLAWEIPLNLTRPVLHLLLLDSDLGGRIYLGAEVGLEDPQTHAMSDLATLIVRISKAGQLDGTLTLPPSTAEAAETFRPLAVGDDGTIYHMVVTPQGLQVTSYTFK